MVGSGRFALVLVPVVFLGATCGGGDGGGGGDPTTPQPLVADPAVSTGCQSSPVAAGAARAKVVACADELIGGRLAAGRVGDFVLENAKVRIIVRGPGAGWYLYGTSGGGIVDAAPRTATGWGEDLVKELQPIVDLNVGSYDELVITEAGDDGPAELVVRGPAALVPLLDAAIGGSAIPLIIEHHYVLAADDTALELRTVLYAADGSTSASTHQLGDFLFVGGRLTTFIPGRGDTPDGPTNGEFVVSHGTTTSFGLVYPPADLAAVQFLDISGIRLAFGPSLDTADRRSRTRWLVIGDGSAASLTERAWSLRGTATGTVTGTVTGASALAVDVHVEDAAGKPITIGRTDASGAFRIALPPGAYQLQAQALGRTPGAKVPVTIVAGAAATADVTAGAAGTLAVSVRDPSNTPLPARVKIEDANGRRIAWTGVTGDASIPLAPGSYRVSVSRGMEYDAFVADPLVVADGATVPLAVTLTRVLDTAGWISLDTHLHSEFSTDSTMPIDERLLAVAGEGVELPVSTDHDFITDYGAIIADLGLDAWLGTMIGEEASSFVWGHLNSWPLVVDDSVPAHGAVPWYGNSPGQVFDLLRAGDATRVVQVNHPRLSGSGLFALIDFDPASLTARKDPVDLGLPASTDLNDFDFDAIEVANGLSGDEFDDVFLDWLALVGAGHPAAATGSSDSHGAGAYAGESRTYVHVGAGGDDPATVDTAAVNEAIKARHVVVAQGAFVLAGLVSPGGAVSLPGDLVTFAGAASVNVRITIQAPPWLPLQRIRVYERDQVVKEIALDPQDTGVVRYDAETTLAVGSADTFFVIRVDAAGPGDPVMGMADGSFTNPLFVDMDGNGGWDP